MENPYMIMIKVTPYAIEPVISNFSPFASAHSYFNFLYAIIKLSNPNRTFMKKMYRHPKCCVMIPPINGPEDNPVYTATVLIPNTFPLSSNGKKDTRIAVEVLNSIAPPIPCTILDIIKTSPEKDKTQNKKEIYKMQSYS